MTCRSKKGFPSQWSGLNARNPLCVQIEDHRGETVYSTETGGKVEIKELGALPADVTEQPRPDQYHTWNGKAWAMTEDSKAQKTADERAGQKAQAKQLQAKIN